MVTVSVTVMGNEHRPYCDGLCVVPDPYTGDQEEKGGTTAYEGEPEQVCLPKPVFYFTDEDSK